MEKQNELKQRLYDKHISKQAEIDKMKLVIADLSLSAFESKNKINKLERDIKSERKYYESLVYKNFTLKDDVIILKNQLLKANDAIKLHEKEMKSMHNYMSRLFKIVFF
jgi:hypothetical protein